MSNKGTEFQIKLKGVIDSTLKKAESTLTGIKEKVQSINKSSINVKFGDKLQSSLKGLGDKFSGVTDNLTGMAKNIPVVGEGLSGVLSTLGPIGIGLTAIAGGAFMVGSHLVEVTKELENVRKQFSFLEKDSKSLDILTAKAQSLKQTFGTSEEEIAKAATTLSKEFGISSVEAMDKLQKALVATNGKLELADVKEFSNQIKSIGGDADTLLTTMSKSVQNGLFSNKSLDALKDFGKNIRGGSDATKEILKSIGKADVLDKVQKGILSQKDAYTSIYKDFDKYSIKQQQELTTLLGGGGEALGAKGIQAIANMSDSLDDLITKGGEYSKQNQTMVKLQEQLATSQLKSSNQIAPLLKKFEILMLKLKIGFQEFINPIVTYLFDIGKEISRLFEGSSGYIEGFQMALKPIIFSIEMVMDRIKKVIQLWVSVQIGIRKLRDFIIDGLGKAIDWVFGEGSMGKIKTFFSNIIDFIVIKWSQLSEVFNQTFEGFRKFIEGDLNAAGDAFSKAGKAGKQLLSGDKTSYKKLDESNPNNPLDPNKTNKDLDKQLNSNVSNAVAGATSEVKNITLNLDSLQKIGTQIINNGGDIKDLEKLLQQLLLQVANDVNQTGSI